MRNNLLILFFLGIPLWAYGQREDFWTSFEASLGGALFEKTDWGVGLQQQNKDNSTRFDQVRAEASIGYGVKSYLKISFAYRYYWVQNLDKQIENEQRLHADLRFRIRPQQFELRYRTRFQYGYDFMNFQSGFYGDAFLQRHLFGAAYKIFGTRFKPYISSEFYHHINHLEGARFTRERYVIGSEIILTNKVKANVNYKVRREINQANPLTAYILDFKLGVAL